MKGINLYIYILKIISLKSNIKIEKYFETPEISDTILNIYKILSNSEQIKKFTKVYAFFLKQYINLIQFKIKVEEEKNSPENILNYYKSELLMNLSFLGNIRKFESDEENIFLNILNDANFIPINKDKNDNKIIINLNYYNSNNIGIINCNDLALNFNYTIKDIDKYKERQMLDLIEYEIKLNSTISKEKMKLNSLKLYFKYIYEDNKNKIKNTEIIIKEYNKEELDKYELGLGSDILIIYKLLLKKKIGKIYLNKVLFSFCKKENIIYSVNIPSEINKTILLTGKISNVLNFKFPKKLVNIGINQLYSFAYEIKKQNINNIKITDYKMIFEGFNINNSQKDNLRKESCMNITEYMDLNNDDNDDYDNNNNKKVRRKISGSFHALNNQSNQNESSLIQFMFKNSNERHLSFHKEQYVNYRSLPPLFYSADEKENCIKEYKNYLAIEYHNFESKLEKGENKYGILIKFSDYGLYKIKLKIKYLIQDEEIGDIMEFTRENIFYFKVINPFKLTNKISSNNYVLYKKNKKNEAKEYLTDSNIKMNLIFNNILEEDIIIKDIKIIPNDILSNKNKIKINSTLKEIIDNKDIEESIKDEILKIIKYSNYTIPFEFEFYKPFYGSIGMCQIIWTTNSLKEFQKGKNNNNKLYLYNINGYEIPNLNVNLIELKYTYEKSIKDNQIILNIKIHNKSHFNKNLIIKFENYDEYGLIISGMLKQKVFLKSNEILKFALKLIFFQKTEIKLPDIIIKELDNKGQELLINYYCPEKFCLNN